MYDIFIAGGFVVSHRGISKLNIGISKEKITYLGNSLKPARKIIHLKKEFVFPGVIDPHVHFYLAAYGAKTGDDYFSGSVLGALGGVTTFIDYAIPKSKKASLKKEVFRKVKIAREESALDFSFHPQILGWNEKIKREILELIRKGFPTFKIFMPQTEGWGVNDWEILKAIEFTSENRGVVEFHAENGSLLDGLKKELIRRKRTKPKFYHFTGNSLCEAEAVSCLCSLGEAVNGTVYVAHLSSEKSLKIIKEARKKKIKIFVETCPQYVFLDKSVYKTKRGFLFCLNPVLKSEEDRKFLFSSLSNGIDWIGTDHCFFKFKDKQKNKNNFLKIPKGLPGIGMSFPLLFESKVSYEKIAYLLSYSPAKHFGFKEKGEIRCGLDADLFVPERGNFKRIAKKFGVYDWFPYEKINFVSKLTIRRGEIILDKGFFSASRGSGRLIYRCF